MVEQALEVGRDEDIHRRRDGLLEGADTVVGARGDEIGEHVVGVGGDDEPAHGKAEQLGVVAREDIAEVAGGHDELDLVAERDGACAHELRIGIEVVGDLGCESPDIDGVRARERDALLGEASDEVGIGEDALHACLGVVEGAANSANTHVGTLLADHLELLDIRDLPVGVEDADADVVDIGEALEGRLAGIAGGCGEHEYAVGILLARAVHEMGEDLQGHILERAGGAVEELEHPVPSQLADRRDARVVERGAVGSRYARGDLLGGVVLEERSEHLERGLLEALAADLREVERFVGEVVPDIKTSVGSDARPDCELSCYRFSA